MVGVIGANQKIFSDAKQAHNRCQFAENKREEEEDCTHMTPRQISSY
jgi:hypothetical protein